MTALPLSKHTNDLPLEWLTQLDEGSGQVDANRFTDTIEVPAVLFEDEKPQLGIYSDIQVGFAFSYPTDWQLTTDTLHLPDGALIKTVSLLNRDPQQRLPGTNILSQAPIIRIDVRPTLPDERNTLTGFMAEMWTHANRGDYFVSEEARVTLSSGLRAQEVRTLDAVGEVLHLFTVINGRGVRLTAIGELSLFWTVASTLRAL